MGGEAYPVTQPVSEVLATARVLDDRAGRAVNLPANGPLARLDGRRERVERRLLRARHELVDLAVAGARLTHEKRPRHIRPIARHLCAEVEEQHLPGLDRPLARGSVGQRSAFAE